MKGVKTNTEAVEGSLSDPEVEVRVSLPAPDDVIPGIGAHEDPIEDLFEGLPEGFPEGLREDRPEDLPGDLPEGLPEDLPEDVRSKLSRYTMHGDDYDDGWYGRGRGDFRDPYEGRRGFEGGGFDRYARYEFREVCRDFKMGRCLRRDCRYSHDDPEDFRDRGPPRGPGGPPNFRGDAGPPPIRDEPCKDFMNGRCKRGSYCKYAHLEFTGDGGGGRGAPDIYHAEGGDGDGGGGGGGGRGPNAGYGSDRGRAFPGPGAPIGRYGGRGGRGGGGDSGGDSEAHSLKPKEKCRDYARGRCARGSFCRYMHDDDGQICMDFKYGKCMRGAECKFRHAAIDGGGFPEESGVGFEACKDFANGKCL
eukprot:454890-Amorphochlora_amoeboformis.AAC.3